MKSKIINTVKKVDRQAALRLAREIPLHVMRKGKDSVFKSWNIFADGKTDDLIIISDRSLALKFLDSFDWEKSCQGFDYWETVFEAIADNVDPLRAGS